MTGIEDFNHRAFNDAAYALRCAGYSVINPAEINPDTSNSREECLRADLQALCAEGVDAICLLPGWEESSGANLEVEVAQAIGLEVFSLKDTLRAGQKYA